MYIGLFSFFFFDHRIKQIHSMLPWVCSVIDHGRRQNMLKTSARLVCHFFVFCDLLLNRRTAAWNVFVKLKIPKI